MIPNPCPTFRGNLETSFKSTINIAIKLQACFQRCQKMMPKLAALSAADATPMFNPLTEDPLLRLSLNAGHVTELLKQQHHNSSSGV
jgi:hypothetical protein